MAKRIVLIFVSLAMVGLFVPAGVAQAASCIAVSMTANRETVRPGEEILYTITVSNCGTDTFARVDTFAHIPTGTTDATTTDDACDGAENCVYVPLGTPGSDALHSFDDTRVEQFTPAESFSLRRRVKVDPAFAAGGSVCNHAHTKGSSNAAGTPVTAEATSQTVCVNVVNLDFDILQATVRVEQSNGVTPVAVLSKPGFDAVKEVGPAVLANKACFGERDSDKKSERDCTENHGHYHVQDVDSDGDLDLLLHYETKQTGMDVGDTAGCLDTRDGSNWHGCDAVNVIKG